MYNSSNVFQEFHCTFQLTFEIVFYDSYFLPQLIFSVHSRNNPPLEMQKVTPAAATFTQTAVIFLSLPGHSWAATDYRGRMCMQSEFLKVREERGGWEQ